MDKREWILVLGAVVLMGAGVYLSLTSDHGGATREAGYEAPRRPRGARGGGGTGGDVGARAGAPGAAARSEPIRLVSDGGVSGGAGIRIRTVPRSDTSAREAVPDRGRPRSADDAEHTSGWRLGQARRRIEILEEREQLYADAVARFEAEGNTEAATRQRMVLTRVQRRLAGLRELERELAEQAAADGTAGDAEQGYVEGEPGNRRVIVPGGPPRVP